MISSVVHGREVAMGYPQRVATRLEGYEPVPRTPMSSSASSSVKPLGAAPKPKAGMLRQAESHAFALRSAGAVWAAAGSGYVACVGFSTAMDTLEGLLKSLRGLENRLSDLAEEMRSPFCACRSGGRLDSVSEVALGSAVTQALEAAGACGEKASKLTEKLQHLRGTLPADMSGILSNKTAGSMAWSMARTLEEGAEALGEFTTRVAELEALRRSFGARAKATLEARASDPSSALGKLAQTLGPSGRMNFVSVTEICEQVEADPEQTAAVIHLLASSLHDDNVDTSKQLKAVTLLHEMLYSERALAFMRSMPTFLETLQRLQRSGGSFAAGLAEENIQMLATEIHRRVLEFEPLTLTSSDSSPESNYVPNLPTTLPWMNLRERTVTFCRRYRTRIRMSCRSGINDLLDDLFRVFDDLGTSLSRISEELECIDVEPSTVGEQVAATRVACAAGADMQRRMAEWKCIFVTPPDTVADIVSPRSCAPSRSCVQSRPWESLALPVVRFLNEAIEVGDGLVACLRSASECRHRAVTSMQVAIESARPLD